MDLQIDIKKFGIVSALSKIMNNDLVPGSSITFDTLFSAIPGVADIYTKVANKPAHCAMLIRDSEKKFNYYIPKSTFMKREDFAGLFSEVDKFSDYYFYQEQGLCFSPRFEAFMMLDDGLRFSLVRSEYLMLPIPSNKNTFLCSPILSCYLLLMALSMIVRYHASDWSRIVDFRSSPYRILVEKGLNRAFEVFVTDLHELLFNYRIENRSISLADIKASIVDYVPDMIGESIIKREREQEYERYCDCNPPD